MKWNYIHIDTEDVMLLTGWKLYVYGNSMKQARIVSRMILETVQRNNVTTKIATPEIIRRNTKRRIAWSICVIYLKPGIEERLVRDLNGVLREYNYSGEIYGAEPINGKLHKRYDLKVPVKTVTYEEYQSLYRGER